MLLFCDIVTLKLFSKNVNYKYKRKNLSYNREKDGKGDREITEGSNESKRISRYPMHYRFVANIKEKILY